MRSLSPLAPRPTLPARRWFAAALLAATLPLLPAQAKPKWDPIPPADLAATECKSHPGASAEVLFARGTLDASRNESWSESYIRVKVYSPKGVEETGVFNVDYFSWQSVWELVARVTKPDGTAAEYGKESFNDAVLAKTEDSKKKRKILAIPNLGVGDIVEMRSTVTFGSPGDIAAFCQQTVPVRECTFTVNAMKSDYNLFSFNVAQAEAKRISSSQTRLEMRNLAPFEKEPFMAPERDVRGWFMLVVSNRYLRWYSKPDAIWKLISDYEEEDFRLTTSPTPTLKAKAQELIRGATTPEERLERLYNFCQETISNLTYFDTPELQEAKKKLDSEGSDKQSPAQTLQRKTGYPNHINELFATLARGAGFELRLALAASRSNTLNVQNPRGWLFVNDKLAAVHLGNQWRLYSPGDYYVPAGLIHQSNEFAPFLRCEADQVVFAQVPVAAADKSPVTRTAHFQIDAEGNLEGDVELRMDGHAGSARKQDWANRQQAEIDDDFRSSITTRLPGAEVSDLTWENLRGRALPLIARYKIKVPGYAESAGSKFIFVPSFFEHKRGPLFTADTRRHPIFFDYARTEHDEIDFQLPEGYVLEAPSAPDGVGDRAGALGVSYQVLYKRRSRVLNYQREFAVGANGAIAFQPASYRAVKALTDAINQSDEHSLVLRSLQPPPEATETPAAATSSEPPANPAQSAPESAPAKP